MKIDVVPSLYFLYYLFPFLVVVSAVCNIFEWTKTCIEGLYHVLTLHGQDLFVLLLKVVMIVSVFSIIALDIVSIHPYTLPTCFVSPQ